MPCGNPLAAWSREWFPAYAVLPAQAGRPGTSNAKQNFKNSF